MIYLRSFTFPDGDREFDYCMGIKRKCYTSYYPFRVLSQRRLERIDFEPVTILCGSNGSGKSTALQVIARKAGLQRESPYNRTSFFDDYVSLCRMDAGDIPEGSRIIASDDVFDRMLTVRELTTASTAAGRTCSGRTWRRSTAMFSFARWRITPASSGRIRRGGRRSRALCARSWA